MDCVSKMSEWDKNVLSGDKFFTYWKTHVLCRIGIKKEFAM